MSVELFRGILTPEHGSFVERESCVYSWDIPEEKVGALNPCQAWCEFEHALSPPCSGLC